VQSAWFVTWRKRPRAANRLFCFHYGGGSATAFREWPSGLGSEDELLAVELPGRASRYREALLRDLGEAAQTLLKEIRPYLDRPFYFFGHSNGSLLGYELACRLRAAGQPTPVHLFLSACGAPHLDRHDHGHSRLPDKEFIERLREFEGTPTEILDNAELMTLVLPILRADFAMAENYVYSARAPLECPITAFGGIGDKAVTVDGLDAWRIHTCGPFVRRMFPGGHFYLREARRELVAEVIARMRSATYSGPPPKVGA
jgi:medium-chain acyl-[acyl-carrier-protein] hydrolase